MRRPATLLAAAALAVLVACSSSGSAGDARASSAEGQSHAGGSADQTPQIPSKVKRAVLHDYQAFWSAVAAASSSPQHDDPRLAQYGSGTALAEVRDTLSGDAQVGVVRRGSQALDATVLSVTGDTATVRDCYTNNLLSYALSGNTLGAAPNTRLDNPAPPKLRIASLAQDNGVWKVDTVTPPLAQQRTCGSIKAEQRVIDAYKRYQRVMYRVFLKNPPNPNDRSLKEVLARQDNALHQVQNKIRDALLQHVRITRSSPSAREGEPVEITAFDARKSATIQACHVDDGQVVNTDTGAVLSPPDTTPTLFAFQLTLEGGAWKVVSETKGEACTRGN